MPPIFYVVIAKYLSVSLSSHLHIRNRAISSSHLHLRKYEEKACQQ